MISNEGHSKLKCVIGWDKWIYNVFVDCPASRVVCHVL